MNFVHADYFIEILFGFLVFFIAYILIIPIAEGGVIALIDTVNKKNQTGKAIARTEGASYGISQGLKYFLPVFEANGITALFKLISIITFTFFLIRLLGVQYL